MCQPAEAVSAEAISVEAVFYKTAFVGAVCCKTASAGVAIGIFG